MIEDNYRHKGLRKKLIEQLAEKGFNYSVLSAMEQVPRHMFLDPAFVEFAYKDQAFPIDAGQTISHPSTVASQTSLLEIKPGERILEVGTGSGYQTCVLMQMGAKVFTIERQKALYQKTKMLLPLMGYRPRFFFGDGYKGLPIFAPFDKILVTAGAPFVPEDLKHQLEVGGILVVPVGDEGAQRMLRITRVDETTFVEEDYGEFRFVPLLKNKAFKQF